MERREGLDHTESSMSKVVKFLKKSEREKAAEALRVLEDAYSYYTPETEPTATAVSKGQTDETVIGVMYAYYSAA